MTNTQLAAYLQLKPSKTREIFEDVKLAFEEVNLPYDIHRDIADLYANGSKPANYRHYLDRLDAVRLVREQGGFNGKDSEMIVKSSFFDPWTLLHNACLYSLDKPLSKEFQALVLDPADKRIVQLKDNEAHKGKVVAKAQKIISALTKPLLKASAELGDIEPWIMAGTYPEAVRIEIDKILFKLGAIDEYGKQK